MNMSQPPQNLLPVGLDTSMLKYLGQSPQFMTGMLGPGYSQNLNPSMGGAYSPPGGGTPYGSNNPRINPNMNPPANFWQGDQMVIPGIGQQPQQPQQGASQNIGMPSNFLGPKVPQPMKPPSNAASIMKTGGGGLPPSLRNLF